MFNYSIIIMNFTKGLDGQRIMIFGGMPEAEVNSQNSLYVLNLASFEWSIPKISGKIPSSRHWHRANVIGQYMVISFGNCFSLLTRVVMEFMLTRCVLLIGTNYD